MSRCISSCPVEEFFAAYAMSGLPSSLKSAMTRLVLSGAEAASTTGAANAPPPPFLKKSSDPWTRKTRSNFPSPSMSTSFKDVAKFPVYGTVGPCRKLPLPSFRKTETIRDKERRGSGNSRGLVHAKGVSARDFVKRERDLRLNLVRTYERIKGGRDLINIHRSIRSKVRPVDCYQAERHAHHQLRWRKK